MTAWFLAMTATALTFSAETGAQTVSPESLAAQQRTEFRRTQDAYTSADIRREQMRHVARKEHRSKKAKKNKRPD